MLKTVRINAYQVGLVFKNKVYQRMLTEGRYWIWNEQVCIYDINQPFTPPVELNIILKDETLAAALHVVEVKDNQIVLMFQDGLLKAVLTAGRYTFWKSAIRYGFVYADTSRIEIDADIDRALLQNRLLTPFLRSYIVESYEKALVFADGKYTGELEGGTYYWWKNAITIHVTKADMRQLQLEINGQGILTKDKTGLRINAWAQYKVSDIEKALRENKEYEKQLYIAFQLALREYVAGFGFDELLEKRDALAPFILEQVRDKAAMLGVKVLNFGIRDIILPGDVKDIMNQVLIAEKKAQANTIMRREETASTRSLLNTAKLMEENEMLWKLKEMEYVEKIADKVSNISVSGSGALIEQLKQIFSTPKAG
jgi:hypothetical protein